MKLKQLHLNSDEVILYIESSQNNQCIVYYKDRHREVYNMTVSKFLKYLNHNHKPLKLNDKLYHCPFQINDDLFSPTMNIKDKDCEYFNLLEVENKDIYYYQILESKGMLDKAKERFLEHKKRELYDEY